MKYSLTDAEQGVLVDTAREPHGLLWSLMGPGERATANSLVRRGLLVKGHADLRRKPRAYFLTSAGDAAVKRLRSVR